MLVAGASAALVGAVATWPGRAAVAVTVYLLATGCAALLTAIGHTLGGLPRERPTRLDARRRSPAPHRRPRELVKLEREVALSTETAFDAHFRLRPAARRIAQARLGARAVALDAHAGTAEAVLGPEAWDLVRPDRPRPRDHDAPGLPLERIDAAVRSLEAL